MAHIADHRLTKKMWFGELLEGKRCQGGQKKRFKDTLKVSLKAFGIKHIDWEQVTQDRDKWCGGVKRGAKACEANRTTAAEQRRQVRKGTATLASAATIPCPHCPRLLRAWIGLTTLHAQCCPPKSASSSSLSSSLSSHLHKMCRWF